jgi:hypothetical protein
MSKQAKTRRPMTLWRMLMWVAAGHLVVILILSPGLYCASANSPDALFARGEQAMADGKYVEAMQVFRQVMDQQPKPPPIYARAAEQHRLADRLARQAAGAAQQQAEASRTTETKPSDTPSAKTTQPATKPASETVPDKSKPFIPPELRQ